MSSSIISSMFDLYGCGVDLFWSLASTSFFSCCATMGISSGFLMRMVIISGWTMVISSLSSLLFTNFFLQFGFSSNSCCQMFAWRVVEEAVWSSSQFFLGDISFLESLLSVLTGMVVSFFLRWFFL